MRKNIINEIKRENMKKTILKVWEMMQDEAINKLNLKEKPTIEFCSCKNAVMYVEHNIMVAHRFYGDFITKTIPEYKIYVNIDGVMGMINFHKAGAFHLAPDIPRIIISQLFYHECRHIWQAEGNFFIGSRLDTPLHEFNQGYGEKREEMDANMFALSMAKTQRERILSKFIKAQQEEARKIFKKGCETEYRDFEKEFNPVLKLLYKVTKN